MVRGRFWAALLTFAVVTNMAVAAVLVQTGTYLLPGVDGAGLLDNELGAEGVYKASYNTKNGRLAVKASGKVQNLSKVKQKYTNPSDVGLPGNVDIPGDIVKTVYTVAKNGKASFDGLAKNVPIEALMGAL